MTARETYVLGDVHGQLERVLELLAAEGLVSFDGRWTGENASLIFVGDLIDRGPAAIEAIDLVMRLQADAPAADGEVESLLGNHDLLVLGALRYEGDFKINHRRNGGRDDDLRRLTDHHIAWLAARPALVRTGRHLIAHADTDRYLVYGPSLDAINAGVAAVLHGDDPVAWDGLLHDLSDRHRFDDTSVSGEANLGEFLNAVNAGVLVHGHTPIPYLTGQPATEVSAPFVYANRRAVNVDGGLYLGGPGFVYRLPVPTAAR